MKTNKNHNYDFPVEMTPISAGGIDIPDRFAIIRQDTKTPLGVVSDKYSIITHSDVIKGMRDALDSRKFDESVELTKDGAQLFATYTLRDMEEEVAKNDVVGMQLTVKNSYDGSSPVQMSLGALRLVCENGMTLSKSFMNFTQRHIGEVNKPEIHEMREKISLYTSQFGDLVPTMNEMTKTQIKPDKKLFDKKETRFPSYLLNVAEHEFKGKKDETVWGYYNSLTYAITHKMRKDSPHSRSYLTDRAWTLASNKLSV